MAAAPFQQERFTIRLAHVSEHDEIQWEECNEEAPLSSPAAKHSHSSSRTKTKPVLIRVAESSPALLQAQQPTTNTYSRVVKYALVRALVRQDILESIHVLSKPKPIRINKLKNKLARLQQTMAIDSNYPMNLVLIRRKAPTPILLDGINSPTLLSTPSQNKKTRKRQKKQTKTTPTTTATPETQQELICLLSSSDSEPENELVASPITRKQKKKQPLLIVTEQEGPAPAEQTAKNNDNHDGWVAQPDPTPIFLRDDLVSTPVGPGRVLDSRIDRLVDTHGDKMDNNHRSPTVSNCSLIHPIITYKIQLAFGGILYISSTQVSSLSTSQLAQQHVLCRYGIRLTRADMVRLWPGVYLNDLLVNFYVQHLQQVHCDNKNNNKVFCFSSYFYTMLTTSAATVNKNNKKRQKQNNDNHAAASPTVTKQQQRQALYKSLERSTKQVDLLTMDYLIIPINCDLHWSFVIVCHPGAVVDVSSPRHVQVQQQQDAPPQQQQQQQSCILHLDSGRHFGLHRSATIYKHIRNYLMACHESSSSTSRRDDGCENDENMVEIEHYYNGKSMPGLSPPVPVQDNLTDCGLYMLEMMERLLRLMPLEINEQFWEKKGHVSPFGKDWFGKDSIEQKRQEMKSLIYRLSQE